MTERESSSLHTEAHSRPNVILIITDDQGYGDLGCHGNPVARTPNLDSLHGESIRLMDFHVAPMCTPTTFTLHVNDRAVMPSKNEAD